MIFWRAPEQSCAKAGRRRLSTRPPARIMATTGSNEPLAGEAALLPAPARPAAVLAPIVARDDGLFLLLTQRASHLREHSGQIAFPGGKIDPGESPLDAALREAEEEIGLLRAAHRNPGLSRPLPDQHRLSRLSHRRPDPSAARSQRQPRGSGGCVRNALGLPDGRSQSPAPFPAMAGAATAILRHAL